MSQPLLQTTAVAKAFGPVVALRSVDLSVAPGEVHALLGANGAGKSTLVKILTGVLRNDSGTVAVNGQPVDLHSPTESRDKGLAPVYQDPALIGDLTVEQNLRLTGADPALVRRELAEMDLDGLDLDEQVRDIPLPFLRMLDLARALAFDPQLLLLDEITAALPPDLSERVFAITRRLKERNRSVLFISHRLAEVREHCDMCTVLRDGRNVASFHPGQGGESQIVAAMLGEASAAVRDVARERRAARERTEDAPRLVVRDLLIDRQDAGVSFEVQAGEVLGMAALEGQGQDRLFEILSGNVRAAGGEILVDGQPLRARHPYDAIRRGVVLVPSNRLMALLPQRPIRENIAIPLFNRLARWGPINAGRERRQVSDAVARLSIDTRAAAQARRLSGGNQQKLTIGRWLAAGFRTLLLFDPTRGIDVGTKHQIYDLVRELADGGAAIVLFTSELREIGLVCDRAAVLHNGAIVAEMPPTASETDLLTAAHGLEVTA
ncbi:MAG TPA: sugar ABC transporter ATP-binding protein, partial [Actinomycetota bacterium]|nr:sugar ABC transporter ATP-binding protein [Actinomycetota bacterium]